MRKILSLILVLLLAISMAVTALADTETSDENSGSFGLTSNVPEASWILNISTETNIPFRSTESYIGTIYVSNVESTIPHWGMELRMEWSSLYSGETPMSLPLDIVADVYDIETGTFIKRYNDDKPNILSNVLLYAHGSEAPTVYCAELYALISEEDWDHLGPADTLTTTVTYVVQYLNLAA